MKLYDKRPAVSHFEMLEPAAGAWIFGKRELK